jgi:hypothetical protein
MKKYSIGGKEFEMQPLTLRQRQLAAPVQKKLMALIQNTVTEGLEKINKLRVLLSAPEKNSEELASVLGEGYAKEEIQKAFGINIDLESIVVTDDKSFEKFLAAILTPAGEKWDPACMDKNIEAMLDIDEATQQEVLQDFLSSRPTLSNASLGFMKDAQSEKPQSSTNGTSES